jgi:3-ketoacyl-CoA synthase
MCQVARHGQDSSAPSLSSASNFDSSSDLEHLTGANAGPDHREYKVSRSKMLGLINWSHVLLTHMPTVLCIGLAVAVAQLVNNMFLTETAVSQEVEKVFLDALEHREIFTTGLKVTMLVCGVVFYIARMDNPVYLIDFATFEPPQSWKVSHEQIVEMMRRQGTFKEDSLDFMKRILERSGTGQATAWPPGITQSLYEKDETRESGYKKADNSIEASRKEAEFVITDVVEKALKKAKLKAKDVDILVINCSLFSPTPSLCAMVISKFGMRSDIQSYNLSGMGCSASLISIDLAKNLLNNRSLGATALVVSTETITPNLYQGNERGFLLQNTLFRCGGAAIVLSNKYTDGQRAKYKLLNTVRVQGTGEEAYQCVFETQDDEGHRGVTLSKDIVKVAGKCMEKNLTTLGPHVLPLSEQIPVGVSIAGRFLCKKMCTVFTRLGMDGAAKFCMRSIPKHYVPDFKRAVDHFCIHAGGRAVIDGIEKNLKLELFHTEPSRAALHNYGNTSSSSIWYELAYAESTQKSNPRGFKNGHRVMQVAFGSGFKCTSAVWLCLKDGK